MKISDIVRDMLLQPRAELHRDWIEEYAHDMLAGAVFPPIVVFFDGKALWLSDGFHRWHAHKVLDADSIDATVHEGSRRQALLYSLSANAKHGLQRGATDYTRAYAIACRNGLVDPTDVEAVVALLQCSGSWAEKLTADERRAAKEQRDAEIIRLKDAGLSIREISRETGVPTTTVHRISVPNIHNEEVEQRPADPPVWVQRLRELESPEAQAWSGVVAALRQVNEQMRVDELYRLRFVGFDHVVAEELAKAHAWINELHGRFVNERDQRRRA